MTRYCRYNSQAESILRSSITYMKHFLLMYFLKAENESECLDKSRKCFHKIGRYSANPCQRLPHTALAMYCF